ncbi:hypothetical protein ACF3M1_02265 [Luteimonas sp. WGS1318]|uniref:hypothetical protein n=1 Tax=Luteimonas sp. WGS1318 TaxID=3366815 RepID=UPI00372D4DBB
MGEAQVIQSLWICSAGYQPTRVSQRAGWNADFAAARIHELGTVELLRTVADDDRSCSADLHADRAAPAGRAADMDAID